MAISMRILRLFLGVLAVVAIFAQTPTAPPPTDRDEFLRHLDQWKLPEYPQKSIDDHHTGTVAAAIQVDATGAVSNVTINTSPDPRMSEAVKTAVSAWTFRPFTDLGKPHAVSATLYIQFRLQPGGPHVVIPGLTQ